MADNPIKNSELKKELKIMKVLPMVLAAILILKLVLIWGEWNPGLIKSVGYIGNATLMPFWFICHTAKLFRFCWFHRMFLFYIGIDMCWWIIDCFVDFSHNVNIGYAILMLVIGISLFIILGCREKIRKCFCPLERDREIKV